MEIVVETSGDYNQACDVVNQHAHLRRLQRDCRPAISNDYIVYLQVHEFCVVDTLGPSTYNEAIQSHQSSSWLNSMIDGMHSMSHKEV